ncbi:hypothetical protein SxD43FB_17300 [Sphingobium sp. D43FB]|nr:hypothetical protein SxD43FB_17300 [Sphingobium sp. D43FB]
MDARRGKCADPHAVADENDDIAGAAFIGLLLLQLPELLPSRLEIALAGGDGLRGGDRREDKHARSGERAKFDE